MARPRSSRNCAISNSRHHAGRGPTPSGPGNSPSHESIDGRTRQFTAPQPAGDARVDLTSERLLKVGLSRRLSRLASECVLTFPLHSSDGAFHLARGLANCLPHRVTHRTRTSPEFSVAACPFQSREIPFDGVHQGVDDAILATQSASAGRSAWRVLVPAGYHRPRCVRQPPQLMDRKPFQNVIVDGRVMRVLHKAGEFRL